MKQIFLTSFAIALCLLGSTAHAQKFGNKGYFMKPLLNFHTIDFESGEKLSDSDVYFLSSEDPNSKAIQAHIAGEGTLGHHQDAKWTMKSRIDQRTEPRLILDNETVIYNKDMKIQQVFQKKYDYYQRRVDWKEFDETRQMVASRSFTINGPICDEANMIFYLQQFLPEIMTGEFTQFDLLTNEPSIKRMEISLVTKETITLPVGDIDSVKLEISEAGAIQDPLRPKTYLWYAEKLPHAWLRYQGYDAGLNSNYVQSYLRETAYDMFNQTFD